MIRTFRTTEPPELSIRVPAGKVELDAVETDETSVDVTALDGGEEDD